MFSWRFPFTLAQPWSLALVFRIELHSSTTARTPLQWSPLNKVRNKTPFLDQLYDFPASSLFFFFFSSNGEILILPVSYLSLPCQGFCYSFILPFLINIILSPFSWTTESCHHLYCLTTHKKDCPLDTCTRIFYVPHSYWIICCLSNICRM